MLAENTTINTGADEIILAVDAEHSGIRLMGCTTFILALIGSFFILALILNSEPVVAGIGSLIIASAIAYGSELYLKKSWPSGRVLVANGEEIALRKRDKIERSINPQQHVNMLSWYFVVKRTSRVKKGWYVIGFSLEQDDEYIPVYTFSSPEDFEKMPFSENFHRLEKSQQNKKDSKSVHSMRVAGEQRRLLMAEQDRGYFGAEITFEELQAYLEFLKKTYPNWMTL